VDLAVLNQPLAAINVGLESFTESLLAQKARVIQVDWRPPAGGNQRLMAILERMKR
jgi:FdrA protein